MLGIGHSPVEEAESNMHSAFVVDGDAVRVVAGVNGVGHAFRIVGEVNSVDGVAISIGNRIGGHDLALPGLAVVVRDNVNHLGGVRGKQDGDVVAVGGHHVVVGAELVAVFAVFIIVDEREVNQFAPGFTAVGRTGVVNVVVVGVAHGDLLAHHDVDVLVVGTAADDSRPGGCTVVIAPVLQEGPFALALLGTIVDIDAGGVRGEEFAFAASDDARPA